MDNVHELLQPLVRGWEGKINQAIRAREEFDDVAEQCTEFFAGACGFMWKPEYKKKFLKGGMAPKFQITLQKAFELVALYGPSLYWQNPGRRVKPRKRIPISPQMLGMGTPEQVQQNPQLAMAFQQLMEKEQRDGQSQTTRAWLYNEWLNYTPGEQPGGGLSEHSELAITEALVTGRGCLWSEWHSMPGSSMKLTGSTFDTNKNLLVDPDCEVFHEAYWIARRRVQPVWEVERRFKLKPGSLHGRGAAGTIHESMNALGETQGDDLQNLHRAQGQTFDLITYYEIFSRGGIGARMTGVDGDLKDALDKVVGDHAYIVIAPGVPYPLNFPIGDVMTGDGMDDDQVFEAFEWPAPFWKDRRFPVCVLDFYRKPRSPWPIAPMSPGIGELTFLNAMIAHLANRIWSSSRNLIAVLKSACKDLQAHLEKGEDLAVIPIDDVQQDINKVISILQFPVVNMDAWKIIDEVSTLFEKRTGMNALLYSMNPGDVQSRSAADIHVKNQYLQVRPDYMAKRVEKWQTEVARNEKILTRWVIEGRDVMPLFGETGAYLWDKEVSSQDPELVLREVDVTVEAGSMRKPNQQRDTENLNQFAQQVLPVAVQYSGVTGDWSPVQGFVNAWGETNEMDVSQIQFNPPPPPPEVQQAQQAQQQLEMAGLEAETTGKQLDVQIKSIELQIKQAEAGGTNLDAQQRQQEFAFDMAERNAELGFKQQSHQQDLAFEREKFGMEMKQDQAQAMQELAQKRQEFLLSLGQASLQGRQQLQQSDAIGKQKVAQAKAQAKAKPKPAASSNGKPKK